MNLSKSRRKRGVILTPEGLMRLQTTIQEIEMRENDGKRYSLEELGERIRVAPKTVSKVFDCQLGTDRRTLEYCFSAFDLELSPWDYQYCVALDDTDLEDELPVANLLENHSSTQLSSLNGIIPLHSEFYIERPPLEDIASTEINKPGGFLTIYSTRQTGKSSLVLRLLSSAKERRFQTVNIKFQLADREMLSSSSKMLRWLCANIAYQLGRRPHLDDFWHEELGNKMSCLLYLQEEILKTLNTPLVLALDNVNRLFEYPKISEDFFALLQILHEEATQSEAWSKLRLIIVYETESSVLFNFNPFNVNRGVKLELPELTLDQVQELSQHYQLTWTQGTEGKQRLMPLVNLLGGHPYLHQIAFSHLAQKKITLERLLETAHSLNGIFTEHLQVLYQDLMTQPELAVAFYNFILTEKSSLSAASVYQLKSLGLITLKEQWIKPKCELYRLFFREQLSAYFPRYEMCYDNPENSCFLEEQLQEVYEKNEI